MALTDADIQDLQKAAGYYQALPKTPNAIGGGLTSTSVPPDLQSAVNYYETLAKTPSVLGTVGKAPTSGLTSVHAGDLGGKLANTPSAVGERLAQANSPAHVMADFGVPASYGAVNGKDPYAYFNNPTNAQPTPDAPPPVDHSADVANILNARPTAQPQVHIPAPVAQTAHGDQGTPPPAFVAAQQRQAAAQAAASGTDQLHFAQPLSGAPGAAGGDDDPGLKPILPNSAPAHVVPAHDVQVGATRVVDETHDAIKQEVAAEKATTNAVVAKNEAVAEDTNKQAGFIQGQGLEAQKKADEVNAKNAKALTAWQAASSVDPDHHMSSMSTGKRIALSVAAALTGFGMSLNHQSGENPILKAMNEDINRDIDAQKNKQTQQQSLYHAGREQGLTEEQAHALVQKTFADAYAKTVQAAGQKTVAQLTQRGAEADSRLYGRAQAQVVGGGSGITPEIAKMAEAIRKDATDKGTKMSPDEALRQALEYHGFNQGTKFQNYVKTPSAAGAGRQAGEMMEHKRLLGRYDSAINMIDRAVAHLDEGYTAGEDDKWNGTKTNLASDVGLLMHGGSSEGAVKAQLDNLGGLNESKARQAINFGSSKKSLEEIKRLMLEKRQQEVDAGRSILRGEGFEDSQSDDAKAADAGATERP